MGSAWTATQASETMIGTVYFILKYCKRVESGRSISDNPDVRFLRGSYIATGMPCLATMLRPKAWKYLMWLLATRTTAMLKPWYDRDAVICLR